ncbi:MAG: hypothetical protein ACRER2_03200 [Methylococcales bacterium]
MNLEEQNIARAFPASGAVETQKAGTSAAACRKRQLERSFNRLIPAYLSALGAF